MEKGTFMDTHYCYFCKYWEAEYFCESCDPRIQCLCSNCDALIHGKFKSHDRTKLRVSAALQSLLDTTSCNHCEEIAEVHCSECRIYLCSDCDERYHVHSKRRDHRRTEIMRSCLMCSLNIAKIRCDQCRTWYCNKCDDIAHTKLQHHIRCTGRSNHGSRDEVDSKSLKNIDSKTTGNNKIEEKLKNLEEVLDFEKQSKTTMKKEYEELVNELQETLALSKQEVLSLKTNRQVKWIRESDGRIPPNAYCFGSHSEDPDCLVYFGRVYTKDSDLIPGTVSTGNRACAVVKNGKLSFKTTNYEVLIGSADDFTWIPCTDDAIPLEAVPVGHTRIGEIIYLGMVENPAGTTSFGAVYKSKKCCVYSFKMKERSCNKYFILAWK